MTRRKQMLDGLDRDIRDHIEREALENVARGMSAEEARRQALLTFGNISVVKEDTRAVWIWAWLDTLRRDVGYAARMLRRNPGVAAAIILTVALGVGGNSAIFSIVNAVLLKPLPYHEPDRLVSVDYLLAGEYLFLREHARTVHHLALYRSNAGVNLSHSGATERIAGADVSANFFSTLGISAALGRTFVPEEEQPGHGHVVVISHALWQQRFGAAHDIIGREIAIDARPHRVVGVMPATFSFPSVTTQLWIPYTFDRRQAASLWGGGQGGEGLARLGPGATPAQVQAERRGLTPRLRQANTVWIFPPGWGERRKVLLLQERLVGDVRMRLVIMLGAVGFVLLIACANVANLLLARASARQREVAIRGALGANRGRLVRQLLTESMVFGLLGGSAGLALAFWGLRALTSSLPADIPRVDEIAIDVRVVAFTFAMSLVTALIFGALPAIRSAKAGVQSSLRTGERGTSATFGRAANLFVVAEVALAVLLVSGAGLLVRSLAVLLRVDPGFRSDHLLTARITLPAVPFTDDARTRAFYADLITRVRALPNVREAEAVSHLPLISGSGGFAFEVEEMPFIPGTGAPVTADRRTTPGYLRAMGIPLLRGRPLADSDRDPTAVVALINDTMARLHWPGVDPIGKRFRELSRSRWTTVVGVVGDVKQEGLANETKPEVYRPFLQMPTRNMSLIVRTDSDPLFVATSLRETAASIDPTVAVSDVRTGEQLVSTVVAPSRFTTFVLGAFAAIALALAAIGIYGVLAYTVTRRSREIGVRMALGARRGDVLRLVLGHALVLAGAGTIVGLAAALACTPLLQTLLFGVGSRDLVTFSVVPLLLLGVSAVAAYMPARKALDIDPATTLRLE